MPKQVLLDELEHDLLVELFNIGVGRAADSLSQIVNQEIKLSVPDIEHISVNQLAIKLGNGQEICSVSQYMKGSFEANTILLFPQHSSMEVVSKMLGEGVSAETLAELHQEGFSEIGNIVLNACIGAFGESIEEVFDVSLPVYSMGTALLTSITWIIEHDSHMLAGFTVILCLINCFAWLNKGNGLALKTRDKTEGNFCSLEAIRA